MKSQQVTPENIEDLFPDDFQRGRASILLEDATNKGVKMFANIAQDSSFRYLFVDVHYEQLENFEEVVDQELGA
jgi:transposase-like protein